MSDRVEFDALFEWANSFVRDYFSALRSDADRAHIAVRGERYVQVRASSLSVEFFDLIRRVYGGDREPQAEAVARSLLFDLAHAIALTDARDLAERLGITDPWERLALGPAHFAQTGWAAVELLAGSEPRPDDDCLLIYDHHHSFEAEAWLKRGRKPEAPVCMMSAGYSSGWCEASFGLPLVATEVLCRARGDDHCRFLMAPPHRIRERIEAWLAEHPELGLRAEDVAIPGFFAERRRAERALHESEARFHQAFAHARHGMALVSIDGKLIKVNPAWSKLFHGTPEQFDGSGIDLIATAEDRKRAADAVMDALEDDTGVATFEITGRTLTGELIQVETSASVIRDELGRPLYLVAQLRDLTAERRAATELREREEQLLRAQRLGAAESLAGGLAHDFNNLLTVILAASEQLEHALDGHPSARTAATIQDAAQRASGVTQQLLAFSRGQVTEARVLDLVPLVQGLRDLITRLVGERIRFEIAVDPRSGAVHADPGQLEQVLVNLAVNARNAMPDGGDLTFRVRPWPEAPWEHGGVTIEVIDTGTGMSPAVRNRAFEPFFTTRAEGTGLGLSVVRSIVVRFGGRVEIDSAPGSGTTVRVLLPAANGPAAPLPRREAAPVVQGRESLLVVEDDPAIRELLIEGLRALGYTVHGTADGEAAIEVVRRGTAVDLVLSDVVMPGLGGPTAVARIRELLPAVRVLFITGYADREIEPHRMPPELPVLRKPFTLHDLATRVREALRSAR